MIDIPDMLRDLGSTSAFERLRGVSFLGIVDYVNKQMKGTRPVYSRAEHSFGVLRLGLVAVHRISMREEDAAYLLATCLLHDLGHPPFSHSLEYAFRKSDRLTSHHDVLREMLLAPGGAERGIPRILRSYGLDPARIFNIVDGSDDLSFFFSAPINIDTLDGIRRSMESFAIFSSYNVNHLATVVADMYVGRAVVDRSSLAEMDRFWENKNLFYRVLSSENPLSLAERRFQTIVRRHIARLERSNFRQTDREFMLRYPQMFREFDTYVGPEDVAIKQDFIIDYSVGSVDRSNVHRRYVRIKNEIRKPRAFAS